MQGEGKVPRPLPHASLCLLRPKVLVAGSGMEIAVGEHGAWGRRANEMVAHWQIVGLARPVQARSRPLFTTRRGRLSAKLAVAIRAAELGGHLQPWC